MHQPFPTAGSPAGVTTQVLSGHGRYSLAAARLALQRRPRRTCDTAAHSSRTTSRAPVPSTTTSTTRTTSRAPYQAPPPAQPGPPAAPLYQAPPPAQPGPPAAPPYQAPPPAQPAASAYEPPVPGVAPAAVPPPNQYAPQPGYPPQYGGPGQPPPPPGWGPQAAPVKKSRRSLWITLAIIFGVLILGIGSCTVWFVGTVKAPVDASNKFLAAIDDGDYAEAISLSDPGCSLGMSEADLAAAFQGADITYNLNNSSVTNSSATVSGSFSVAGQNVTSISLQLRNIDGWRICGFNAN